jgi:hypothetical protein
MKGVPAEVLQYLPLSNHIPQGEISHHPAFHIGL